MSEHQKKFTFILWKALIQKITQQCVVSPICNSRMCQFLPFRWGPKVILRGHCASLSTVVDLMSRVTLACSNEFQYFISIAYFSSRVASMVVKVVWYLPGRKEDTAHMANTIQPLGHIWLQVACATGDPSSAQSFEWPFELPNGSPWSMFDHVCLARRPQYTRQIGLGDAGESAARKKTRPFKRNWDRHPSRQLFSNSPIYRQLGLC